MDGREIIKLAGGPVAVGKAVNRTHNTVSAWKKIPPIHARVVAKLANLSVHEVRPDVFGPSTPDLPDQAA